MDLNGRTIREPSCLGATRIDGEAVSHISYISSYLCMHKLLPKGQSTQVHGPKPLCVLRWAPKAYISFISQYQYLCNYHIACMSPQKAKAPKHTAQNLYVCSDGPQTPLISYHLYYCIWKGRVPSNNFANNLLYTYIHI